MDFRVLTTLGVTALPRDENPAIYELDLNEQDPEGKIPLNDNRPVSAPIETVPVEMTAF